MTAISRVMRMVIVFEPAAALKIVEDFALELWSP
jgi:hypothetical protein